MTNKLVNFAKFAIPRILEKSEIFGLQDNLTGALIQAFPGLRPDIGEGNGPLGSSIFDDEDFLLSGIADIEYEYDYDTGEVLGLKTTTPDPNAPAVEETTTETPSEDSTEVSEADSEIDVDDEDTEIDVDDDDTEIDVNDEDNEVDVEPRRPKALDDDEEEEPEEEEFETAGEGDFKRVKIGCCWYAASQVEQKGRQPKTLGGFGPGPPAPQGSRPSYLPTEETKKKIFPVDEFLRSLGPPIWIILSAKYDLIRSLIPPSTTTSKPTYKAPSSYDTPPQPRRYAPRRYGFHPPPPRRYRTFHS